ncbi:hypothetical protein FOE78_15840 [Microlunatus elymi]|uniref:Uncharacterized protein n=1 Tax=Microlunatus elymi TaxID=2596828 RepID=A0A516Q1E1_9ACTN|nr:hypothetical protein [Microlunatus elymi]QDP97202.1 hypothetical protein FOE78_15840 [Microlunatus elymi]
MPRIGEDHRTLLEQLGYLWRAQLDGLVTSSKIILCCYDPAKRDAALKVLWRCDDHEYRLVGDFHADQPQSVLLVCRSDRADSAT